MLNTKKKTEEESIRKALHEASLQAKSGREYNAMKFDDLQNQVKELSAEVKQLNSLLTTTLKLVFNQSKKIVYMEKVARALEVPMAPVEVVTKEDEHEEVPEHV